MMFLSIPTKIPPDMVPHLIYKENIKTGGFPVLLEEKLLVTAFSFQLPAEISPRISPDAGLAFCANISAARWANSQLSLASPSFRHCV
jgi:hypothetical protein